MVGRAAVDVGDYLDLQLSGRDILGPRLGWWVVGKERRDRFRRSSGDQQIR